MLRDLVQNTAGSLVESANMMYYVLIGQVLESVLPKNDNPQSPAEEEDLLSPIQESRDYSKLNSVKHGATPTRSSRPSPSPGQSLNPSGITSPASPAENAEAPQSTPVPMPMQREARSRNSSLKTKPTSDAPVQTDGEKRSVDTSTPAIHWDRGVDTSELEPESNDTSRFPSKIEFYVQTRNPSQISSKSQGRQSSPKTPNRSGGTPDSEMRASKHSQTTVDDLLPESESENNPTSSTTTVTGTHSKRSCTKNSLHSCRSMHSILSQTATPRSKTSRSQSRDNNEDFMSQAESRNSQVGTNNISKQNSRSRSRSEILGRTTRDVPTSTHSSQNVSEKYPGEEGRERRTGIDKTGRFVRAPYGEPYRIPGKESAIFDFLDWEEWDKMKICVWIIVLALIFQTIFVWHHYSNLENIRHQKVHSGILSSDKRLNSESYESGDSLNSRTDINKIVDNDTAGAGTGSGDHNKQNNSNHVNNVTNHNNNSSLYFTCTHFTELEKSHRDCGKFVGYYA